MGGFLIKNQCLAAVLSAAVLFAVMFSAAVLSAGMTFTMVFVVVTAPDIWLEGKSSV